MHMLIRREASVIIRSRSQQIRQKVGACRAGANIVSACFLVFPYDARNVPSRRQVAEKIVQTLTLTDIRLRRPTCQPRRRCQRHGSEQIIQTCAVPGVPGTASTTRQTRAGHASLHGGGNLASHRLASGAWRGRCLSVYVQEPEHIKPHLLRGHFPDKRFSSAARPVHTCINHARLVLHAPQRVRDVRLRRRNTLQANPERIDGLRIRSIPTSRG